MLERTLTKEENSVQIFFFSPGDGPSNRLRLKCPVSATLDRGIDFSIDFYRVVDQDTVGSGTSLLRIRIQQKRKEQINKNCIYNFRPGFRSTSRDFSLVYIYPSSTDNPRIFMIYQLSYKISVVSPTYRPLSSVRHLSRALSLVCHVELILHLTVAMMGGGDGGEGIGVGWRGGGRVLFG